MVFGGVNFVQCIPAPSYAYRSPCRPRVTDVYPALAEARGWRWRKVLRTPWLL
jgi:hypothetical protein